ncbi:1-aminocyclopropane-1-carboxylate synthase-like protein 1 [Gastrophryne carolinensis]
MAAILSDRGREIISNSDLIERALVQCLQDPYDKLHNPQGFVNLGVAENKVCLDVMQERVTRPDMTCLDTALLGYTPITGIRSLKEEAARFLTDYCRAPAALDPDNVTEEGGRPFQLTVQQLEDGMAKAKQQGIGVKAMILINPHNPLGDAYAADLLLECLEFAHRHELHVIVEEVYMLSVLDATFTSVLSLDSVPDPERTHFIWGVNKSSSLVLVSSDPHPVADPDWLDNVFLPTNRKRLSEAQRIVVSGLQELGIPVHSRSNGIFVWADFRQYLTSGTFEAEAELWEQFIDEKLCITPGKTFHCCQPGWFRVTTSMPADTLTEGLQRLKKVLQRSLHLRVPVQNMRDENHI